MKAVLALDLDQTLIFSARSAEPLDGTPTVWVEDYLGEPLSLMTARAHERLTAISERHHVVPVTTRTPEQLARVRLPGRRAWAICSNGGVLLLDGVRDEQWDERIAGELASVASAGEVLAWVEPVRQADWVRSLRQVEDLFVYLVAQGRDVIPERWLADLTGWAAARGWSVSVQGRKVYVVPVMLSKGAAATRVAELLGGPLLAAGDSLLDRSLLEAAVCAARPAHGELHATGYQLPDLFVSKHSGARAAEEILDHLGDRADLLTG